MLTYLLALSIICSAPQEKVQTAVSSYVEESYGSESTEYQYDYRRVVWPTLPERFDSVAVVSISKDNPLGNTLFNVAFFESGSLVRMMPLSVEVTAIMDVLIASTPINAGDPVIDFYQGKGTVNDGHMLPITDPDLLQNKQAKVNIQPGNIIYPSMIISQSVLDIGDKVDIIAEKGMIKITADGIARQRGGIGDVIKVMNVGSRKIVKAEVLDSQTVALK